MVRTQVYLTEEQTRDIKLRAKRQNKPEAEVIREVARRAHSPEIRDECFALADRYDRLAEHAARRESAAQVTPIQTC